MSVVVASSSTILNGPLKIDEIDKVTAGLPADVQFQILGRR